MAVISAGDVAHPFDTSARRQLDAMPGLPATLAAFTRLGGDRVRPDLRRSGCARLGPDRRPDIYRLLPPICAAFGIAEPGLYLAPAGSAPDGRTGDGLARDGLARDGLGADGLAGDGLGADGSAVVRSGPTRAAVVIGGDLPDQLARDEVQAVLARECGHILLRHLRYRSLARFLRTTRAQLSGPVPGSVRDALIAWLPTSELSADRAAAAYLGDADAITRVMFRLTGVGSAGAATPAVRVREIQAWTATAGFARLAAQVAGAGRVAASSTVDLRVPRPTPQLADPAAPAGLVGVTFTA